MYNRTICIIHNVGKWFKKWVSSFILKGFSFVFKGFPLYFTCCGWVSPRLRLHGGCRYQLRAYNFIYIDNSGHKKRRTYFQILLFFCFPPIHTYTLNPQIDPYTRLSSVVSCIHLDMALFISFGQFSNHISIPKTTPISIF